MTYKNYMCGSSACLDVCTVLFDHRLHCSDPNCSLGVLVTVVSLPSNVTQKKRPLLLGAVMAVVFMVVVLSLALLVTEEVAPPTPRVMDLCG